MFSDEYRRFSAAVGRFFPPEKSSPFFFGPAPLFATLKFLHHAPEEFSLRYNVNGRAEWHTAARLDD